MPAYAPMLEVTYYAQNYAGIIRQWLKTTLFQDLLNPTYCSIKCQNSPLLEHSATHTDKCITPCVGRIDDPPIFN